MSVSLPSCLLSLSRGCSVHVPQQYYRIQLYTWSGFVATVTGLPGTVDWWEFFTGWIHFITANHTLRFNGHFPGKPHLASCPLNSPSSFTPKLHTLLGLAANSVQLLRAVNIIVTVFSQFFKCIISLTTMDRLGTPNSSRHSFTHGWSWMTLIDWLFTRKTCVSRTQKVSILIRPIAPVVTTTSIILTRIKFRMELDELTIKIISAVHHTTTPMARATLVHLLMLTCM